MADINNVILLVNDVKKRAVAKNQLVTAQVLNNVASELRELKPNSYEAKRYLANVVPKLHSLNTDLR
jgi:hypothetical protein